MNKSNAHLYLPLVQALADGKTIQLNMGTKDQASWSDREDPTFGPDPSYYRIKPASFPPLPEGMSWHNTKELTAEQVGDEHRLIVTEEVDGRYSGDQVEYWSQLYGGPSKSGVGWSSMDCFSNTSCRLDTYRVQISTPFPDGSYLKDGQLVKPWKPKFKIGDRVRRIDDGSLRTGSVVSVNHGTETIGVTLDAGTSLVCCEEDLERLPEPAKRVPLGPSNIPPGSAIRQNAEDPGWAIVVTVGDEGIDLCGLPTTKFYSFQKLKDGGYQILRPGQTEWQPCYHEVQP